MKNYLLILFIVLFSNIHAQENNFEELLDKGKAEFKKEFDQQDYAKAVEYLEKAVALNPKHSEARYFLGYAYSRLNSKDGKSMIDMDLQLNLKSSEQFETIIKLSPKYEGEMLILDPYSKLTAEWGSLAMSYWHKNIPDSAKWAFAEGKKRGGFSNFILSLNRCVLDACGKNSILISSGDNYTIPLWYLQIVEGYRNDVSVVDISLLNTKWYPSFLNKNNIVAFDLPSSVIDTIEYCLWSDSVVRIGDFSWTVQPSYFDQYLLRGDLILMSLLKQNNFKREVFFTTGFIESQQLSLTKYLSSQLIVDKLTPPKRRALSSQDFENKIKTLLMLSTFVNKNSTDEMALIGNLRYYILQRIGTYIDLNDKANAKNLFFIMDKYLNETDFPYLYESWKESSDTYRKLLN